MITTKAVRKGSRLMRLKEYNQVLVTLTAKKPSSTFLKWKKNKNKNKKF